MDGVWHGNYVMMGNHYHLLLETPEGNLVAGMKWFQGAYTQRYNSRHQVFGHKGEVSAVTRAIRMVKSGRDAKVERMKKQLVKLYGAP